MTIPIVIYCFIQGLTEFLPVSSQGHLVIFNNFFPISKEINIRTLNIIAHFGSLLAVIIYYHKAILKLMVCIPNILRSDIDKNVSLLINITISTLPIFLIGYILMFFLHGDFFNSLKLVGWTTLIFGILLLIIDKNCLRIKNIDDLPKTSALLIGLAQCLAIIPGVSRSGSVITIMRLFGYERIGSAHYSNLLSIPAIIGAVGFLFFLDDESKIENIINLTNFLIFSLSFLFSIIFISFMISWLKRSSFAIFMYYRIILGLFVLAVTYSSYFI